jgi:dihydrofolate synthase / folylpolyglutamate synthase
VNYPEALAWLYGLQRFGIKLGLENIRRLITALQIDLGEARVIHVAGTNGKGSVCAMIDSILRAQKYRTGLFTSPHLVTFRERIRVDGEMISEDAVAKGLTAIRDLVRDWDPRPTFF